MSTSERIASIRRYWKEIPSQDGICLCITGSFAREEETLHSDLDILLLYDSEEKDAATAQEFISLLHRGVEHVSIITRSLKHCSAMMDEDVRSWVSQMDARYLLGSRTLFCSLRSMIKSSIAKYRTQIVLSMEELSKQRHQEYGDTIALLEPNVKNSSGALRDVHTMYYMEMLHTIDAFDCNSDAWPRVATIIAHLPLQDYRRKQLTEAYLFLLQVRKAMHTAAEHLHDTLDFHLQRNVAEMMGFGSADEKQAVEQFMRQYYRHAYTVHVSMQLLFDDSTQKALSGRTNGAIDRLMSTIQQQPAAEHIMAAFLHMNETGSPVPITLRRILDAEHTLDFSPFTVRDAFDRIVRSHSNVYATLSRMHELRVLGSVLPEFEAMNHFFQHNIYHFFTADEHTLRAIRYCEELCNTGNHPAVQEGEILDRSVLIYAILLHDIAKPLDLAHHEIAGADLVPEILGRFAREDIIEDVQFLVRHHLLMEQLAFRRNFRSISSLKPFAETVNSVRRLNLLYVLTYADMAALNPGVLTEWKKELLLELYTATRSYLEHGKAAFLDETEKSTDVEHLTGISHHDFQTAVQDILEGELVRIHVHHQRAYSEITVFCVDRPQLLSQLSAAFFGADSTIVDAGIETRNEVAIDMFRVVDIISGKHLSSSQTADLRQLIRNVCSGELDAEQLYARYRRKWIRRLRKLPRSNVKTDVEYVRHTAESGKTQTIIEVYAPDTFGLLYRVAGEISAFGLNVVFAKIASRVDGVVDSFYVEDEDGQPFDNLERRSELRNNILDCIRDLTQL